eukprot:CAMPEP_0181216532 /NCGR_PEP_ID=MMETSP1096-20121128/26642_1 /TAXON_ID=156174 ORGANISM="Chrysochromulina ericina, Strain CCMP281" /NCGR_SAMPLE_ID=MMETSP1096 /ASSEMBLY_ACC=CAM_ASM_000453 /LENGTH=87 /DNA_ID=CAMNT_0023308551 /DNA_START=505 /DNA_END=763 /DNA_ORIENTATION=-
MAQVVRGIAPPGLQRRAHHLGGMSAPEASCCSSPAEGWGSGKGGKDAGQGVSHGRTHVASDSQYAVAGARYASLGGTIAAYLKSVLV